MSAGDIWSVVGFVLVSLGLVSAIVTLVRTIRGSDE